MKSARRLKRLENKSNEPKSKFWAIAVALVFCMVLSLYLFFKFNAKNWDGYNKVSFVFQKPSGDVGVTVLDPLLNEENTLIIPGNTQIDVARNYGTLLIKNIWQLGINEKLGGTLLTQTVTDNFLFPTSLWVEFEPKGFWQFIFSPGKTNIPFSDRVYISLFKLKVKSIDKSEIDLGKSQFLKQQVLTDGTKGFVIAGPISERLTVYFSDNEFANGIQKFAILDYSNNPWVSNNLGQILEVMGGKVVSLDKGQTDTNLDCEVWGKNVKAVKKISEIFNCRKVVRETSLDLEFKFGARFAERF